jgi:Tfp pilus assembly PilM family ATPase
MRKGSDGSLSVVCADVLAVQPYTKSTDGESGSVTVTPLSLPPKLRAKYACIAVTGESAIIKLLSFPGRFDESAEAKVVENMGLESPENYRISFKVINEGHGKAEARVLTVALPETEAASSIMLFPTGAPAPFSLEISGLATMSAFLRSCGEEHKENAVGVIDFGDRTTSFGLFNKNYLALVRRFPVGAHTVLGKVQETLGVDLDTAQGIISDGSFDISQSVSEVMEPLIKQLIVSRDFVERRENCQLSKLYVSGALVVSRDLTDEMRSSVGVEIAPWNPFQGLTVAQGALPESFAGQEWKFSAAAGACIATFEET